MRFPDSRPVLAATLLAGLALTACTSSGGDKQTTPPPTTAPVSTNTGTVVPTSTNKQPLIITGVTAKQNAALIKLVPRLPGVQNTSYDGSSKTLRVVMRATASNNERAVVVSQLKKFTGKTAVIDTEQGPTAAPSKTVSVTPTSSKTS